MPVFEQVLEKYPQDVKVVFKNFPLRNHKFAEKAAIAALAAGEQGKFWEFHDLLFQNYNKLNDQKIQEIAQTVGLNLEEYEKKKNDPTIKRKVNQDISDGRQAGVRGTPAFFVNGVAVKGARPLEDFVAIIEKELEGSGS